MRSKTAGKDGTSQARRHASRVLQQLRRAYPDARCALEHRTPFQLLVATILSAQCTDKRVNLVAGPLFARYPSAREMARVPAAELESLIQSTGFFRNKARHILACSAQLVEQFQGEVPADLEALVALPGVGRKTANVVLGTAFGLPTGVVVDTHVTRISRRLGLTDQRDPVRIERQLMAVLPRDEWIDYSHRVIQHGRRICLARRPRCTQCALLRICPREGLAEGSQGGTRKIGSRGAAKGMT